MADATHRYRLDIDSVRHDMYVISILEAAKHGPLTADELYNAGRYGNAYRGTPAPAGEAHRFARWAMQSGRFVRTAIENGPVVFKLLRE